MKKAILIFISILSGLYSFTAENVKITNSLQAVSYGVNYSGYYSGSGSSTVDARDVGMPGGLTYHYTNVDWSVDTPLWGISLTDDVKISTQGPLENQYTHPGTSLVYQSGPSNPSGGVLVYTGYTNFMYLNFSGSFVVSTQSTRCTVTVTDNLGSPLNLSSDGASFYFDASTFPDFDIHVLMEMVAPNGQNFGGITPGVYYPVIYLFDQMHTNPTNPDYNLVYTSYNDDFYSYYNIWYGTSNDWATMGNWSNDTRLPVSTDYVLIPSIPIGGSFYPVMDDGNNYTVDVLHVENSASIHINPGSGLTANACINEAGTAGIVLNSDASGMGTLIEFDQVEATVNRYFTGNEPDWHLIASPVSNAFSEVFLDMYLQWFDETTNTYNEIIPVDVPLNAAQGYAVYSTLGTDNTVVFEGILNSISSNIDVTHSATAPYGWNLVGNPFTASIDWNHVIPRLSGTGINNSIYYLDAASGAWLTWNGSTGSGSQYIPPLQGFFISTDYNDNLAFDMGDRSHLNSGSFYKESEALNYLVELKITGNGFEDRTFIHFNQDYTSAFDGEFDAYKIISVLNPLLPQLYTIAENEKMSINGLPETESLSLFVNSQSNGMFTISLEDATDFGEILLEDLQTGDIVNLLEDAYSFEYNNTEDDGRFVLHFTPLSVTENLAGESLSIYAYDRNIIIDMPDMNPALVRIFDVNGRLMLEENILEGHSNINTDLSTGFYLVEVIAENMLKTEKVFIQ